jgi:hypothetical protein
VGLVLKQRETQEMYVMNIQTARRDCGVIGWAVESKKRLVLFAANQEKNAVIILAATGLLMV